MKILQTTYLIKEGAFSNSPEWETRLSQIQEAIRGVAWPIGSETFTLNPIRRGNGVTPIKHACMNKLLAFGWSLETRFTPMGRRTPGPIDATCHESARLICLEWETGNVSSSHRALNKMCWGMLTGEVIGGVLIIPSREMARYLTDRIGNYPEIEPFFPFWRMQRVDEGVLAIIEIEHDALSAIVPNIPKGKDGNAPR